MKQIVNTDKAPAAIGPYSQAIEVNGMVFTSGQLPLNPATGAFPEGIAEQTRQSLTNVKAILEQAGLTMDSVVKTTVFLSDMNNFGAMNEVYATFFSEGSFPARSAVEVARLELARLADVHDVGPRLHEAADLVIQACGEHLPHPLPDALPQRLPVP